MMMMMMMCGKERDLDLSLLVSSEEAPRITVSRTLEIGTERMQSAADLYSPAGRYLRGSK
jgi:hypothetical protein